MSFYRIKFSIAALASFTALQMSTAGHSATLIYSTYVGGNVADSFTAIAVDFAGFAYLTGNTASSNFPVTAGAFQTAGIGDIDGVVTKLGPGGNSVVYSTYLGGSDNDFPIGIAIDNSGNAYITGSTSSTDYPTVSPFQNALSGTSDAFITILNSAGSGLNYSTYYGGSADDGGAGITTSSTALYVAGFTSSSNFPVTGGVAQGTSGGSNDAFVLKFNLSGSTRLFSTYLGGTGDDFSTAIALDTSGNPHIAGYTTGSFPTTGGAFQTAFGGGTDDAFAAELNSTGTTVVYATYLGGSASDEAFGITTDPSGNAYVTGLTASAGPSSAFPTTFGAFQTTFGGTQDAFISKLNVAGTSLVYSTFLGGSGTEVGSAITLDNFNDAFVTGKTGSTNFPITSGAVQQNLAGGTDVFISGFNATGTSLLSSTYLGGPGNDFGKGIALDSNGDIFVAGGARQNFRTTADAFQPFYAGGSSDGIAVKISQTTTPANHVLLYDVVEQFGAPPAVTDHILLEDRFIRQIVDIERPVAYGNPVEKTFNNEDFPIVLNFLHYVAYFIDNACPSEHQVSVDDQFGTLNIHLSGGHVLLVPTQELAPTGTVLGPIQGDAHFRCYDVNASGNPTRIHNGRFITSIPVTLEDEFTAGAQGFNVISPAKYCVAARKTHNGLLWDADTQDPANNYMCYEVIPNTEQASVEGIRSTNQLSSNTFKTLNPVLLCVPSAIVSSEPPG
jgi:hypothetical protein